MVKVLLIEDDLFLRDIYLDFLTDEGFEVVSAVDGEEGFEKLKQGGWDIVLVDDNLPKMMGIDILRGAKKIDPKPFKKIAFLTNEAAPNQVEDERLQLCDAYLVKSEYSPEQLIDKIKEVLAS